MIFYVLGFFMVLPLYIVFPSVNLFIVENYSRDINPLAPAEIALPVSIIAAMLITLIFVMRSPRHLFRMLVQYGLIVLFLFDLGLVTSLFFGMVLTFILNARFFFGSFSTQDSAKIFYGSVFALGMVSLGTLYDFLIYHSGNIDLLYGVNSSFGYEIYAFYVSYSSVVTLFLMLLISDLMLKKIVPAPVSLVCILLLVISIFGASRKAAFLELFLYFIILIPMTFDLLKLKVSLRKLLLSCAFLLALVAYYFWMQNYRPFSGESMIESREGSNMIFLGMLLELNLWQFLFGWEAGSFGGYSNLLLDLFARLGILGVLTIASIMLYAGVNLVKYWGIQKFHLPILLAPVVNVMVGNVANLNLTQPYYVTSLIAACFLLNIYRMAQ